MRLFAQLRAMLQSDHMRLLVFSCAILLAVSLFSVAAAIWRCGFDAHHTAMIWSVCVSLVLIIAGGTLLVRVAHPFLRRLEESEARLRAIVSTAGDAIITVDQQGTVQSFNHAAQRIFGISDTQALGRSIDELITLPSGLPFSRDQLLGRCDSPRHLNQPAAGQRAGIRVPLEYSLSRFSVEQQTTFTVIVRDVTERELAQQQMKLQMCKLQEVKEHLEVKAAELAKTNRELDDFTYIASHDLKEPLRGISSYCQILLEDYQDKLDDDGRRRLEALVSLCQRLSRLIDDLLTYSKIGRTQPETTPTDLDWVVSDVVETLRPAIEQRHAKVEVRGPLPKLPANQVWIGEVFRNLITNALKFNEQPQPSVEIGSLAGATIYVRDNGIGIPECHQEAIFTMFRRLHSRKKYDGTGAGLTFVRKIVEAHGGRVWVRSEPGHGSTFYFTLAGIGSDARQFNAPCTVG